jgi:hypothetical protein
MINIFQLTLAFLVLILKPSVPFAIENNNNNNNFSSQILTVAQKNRLIRKNAEQKKNFFNKEAKEKIEELEKALKAKLKNRQVTRKDRVGLQLEFCKEIDFINFNLYKLIIEINEETENLLNKL